MKFKQKLKEKILFSTKKISNPNGNFKMQSLEWNVVLKQNYDLRLEQAHYYDNEDVVTSQSLDTFEFCKHRSKYLI